jgi:hypothetical protein
MFDSPLITVDSLAMAISIVICALAAYRAFTSRRVLATPLYRNRALWTGTAALMLILGDVWGIALENTNSSVTFGIVPPPGTLEFYLFVIVTAAFAAVIFAWIDSTVRVALELDFTHRDTLAWKTLRPVAGTGLVIGIIAAQFSTAAWEIIVSAVLLAGPVAYMTAALVVGRSRVRNETMRRYIRWMSFLVASLLLQVGTSAISPYLNFPLTIAAYFLYGISTSLLKTAPLSVAAAAITASVGQPEVSDQGPI